MVQLAHALSALQARFKPSQVRPMMRHEQLRSCQAHMRETTNLLRVILGDRVPMFRTAGAICARSTYVAHDVCPNDCIVYNNAPLAYDPTRERQCASLTHCPRCKTSRFVLSGPMTGKARKRIVCFPLEESLRSLMAQPGWAAKLNNRRPIGEPIEVEKYVYFCVSEYKRTSLKIYILEI